MSDKNFLFISSDFMSSSYVIEKGFEPQKETAVPYYPDRLKSSLKYGLSVRGRRLVWFRTLAFQANDPGFKSRRPHHNPTLFCCLGLESFSIGACIVSA